MIQFVQRMRLSDYQITLFKDILLNKFEMNDLFIHKEPDYDDELDNSDFLK